MSPEELVQHNEHADEWGGYFVIKVIMLLTNFSLLFGTHGIQKEVYTGFFLLF